MSKIEIKYLSEPKYSEKLGIGIAIVDAKCFVNM